MKLKIIKSIATIILIVTTIFSINAQPAPPPPGSHGSDFNKPAGENGGGAPIGNGLIFFLALAGAYVIKKTFQEKGKNTEEMI